MRDFSVNSASFFDILEREKSTVYTLIFYASGLVCGSFSYYLINSTATDKVLKSLFLGAQSGFIRLFFENFTLYFSVFLVLILLGMCIVGFSIIHGVALVGGFFLGLKIAFFYVTYSFKGFGYSLLMIIPEGAALMTVLIYTISVSAKLSNLIYKSATGKEQGSRDEIKSLLTKYLKYAVAVILIALINSSLSFFLREIISIN